MKQCPRCNRNYADEALSFCLEDGVRLVAKYDPDKTMIVPYPPVSVVPPTAAYQGAPVAATVPARDPALAGSSNETSRKSPWVVGIFIFVALGVGLAIGGFVFTRSSSSTTAQSSTVPERNPVTTSATTPTPISPAPTPASEVPASPTPNVEQSTAAQRSNCILYNDRSDLSVVNVREGCDKRNCELDASTKAGEYPDRTAIRVIMGSNVATANFTWVKIVIVDSERIVWVAASKIKCT